MKMVYRVIGAMSGSSLDGLDLCFVEFHETSGKWNFEIRNADCQPYSNEWIERLSNAIKLSASDYVQLDVDFGHYVGSCINRFIEENNIQFQVQLIGSHGHTTFHRPSKKMTAQLGDGAAIAAETGINTVSDLRAMDLALGGQGAPIVPIGEQLLLGDYDFFLNLGGIANLSVNSLTSSDKKFHAYDLCPANRVLNLIMNEIGKEYDDKGTMASKGIVNENLLQQIDELEYYKMPAPKSLANDFGTDVVYPMIQSAGLSREDALRTMVEHIALQVKQAIAEEVNKSSSHHERKMLVTGGGAFNLFMIDRLKEILGSLAISVEIPEPNLIQYKEALIMGLMAVLRWREENNILASVTGAKRNSINGAVWMGQEG